MSFSTPSESLEFNASEPLVLLLGNVDHEGITSLLKSGQQQFKKKLLDSSPDNWRSISDYFDEFAIRAVVVKLNAAVYGLLAHADYEQVRNLLLDRLAQSRNIVFVFEDLLSGQRDAGEMETVKEAAKAGTLPDYYDLEDFEGFLHNGGHLYPPEMMRNRVNGILQNHGLNVVPYKTNADLTVVAAQFLTDAIEQLLFRVYVPRDRLWANEVGRLLQLFRDYLLKTGRGGVRLDQKTTDLGVCYEFHGEQAPSGPSLGDDFQDFSHFLDICVSDPPSAEALLRQKNVNEREIAEILTRYSIEAKRLQTDLKHDRERKLLSVRQRLESELADALPPSADWQMITALVEGAFPFAAGIGDAYLIGQGRVRSDGKIGESSLVVNLSPQIINTVNGVVAREIRGQVNFSREDDELLELIGKFGGKRSVELTSAVHELSDQSIPRSDRLARGQKLKAFLYSLGSGISGVATNILQTYIEHKLGLK